MQKWHKMFYLLPNVSFGCSPTEAFKSHPETSEALIIKWTTSDEPPVGSQSHQNSKWGHSWAILLVTNWLPPCIQDHNRKNSCSRQSWRTKNAFIRISCTFNLSSSELFKLQSAESLQALWSSFSTLSTFVIWLLLFVLLLPLMRGVDIWNIFTYTEVVN